MKYIMLITIMLSFCCLGCSANQSNSQTDAQDNKVKMMNTRKSLTQSVKLNSGYSMPVLGLGTWTLRGKTCENAVYTAIKCGYRLIDTARYYGNEIEVGNGIKKAIADGIIRREDIFVTSKIMPGDYQRPDAAIDDSMARLGLWLYRPHADTPTRTGR